MNKTETVDNTTEGGKAKGAFDAATDAAMHLRDAISAVALLVHDTWDDGPTADRARNALEWIAEAMDRECDALHGALESVRALV